MDAKDWLPILFERSNATSALWNIEIVTILGIVAFLAGAGSQLSHRGIRVAILVGFWIMASFNLYALAEVTEQRAVLAALIRKTDNAAKIADLWSGSWSVDPLHVPPLWVVLWGHLVIDAVVSLFVWFYPGSAPRTHTHAPA